MQDVPLANRGKIHKGTKVKGKIVSASADRTQGARIVFRFDVIESRHEEIPIVASLRATASFMEVLFAKTPETTPGTRICKATPLRTLASLRSSMRGWSPLLAG